MSSRFSQSLSQRLQTLQNNISLDFSIENLSKSPARFNKKKLDWFNRHYIKMLDLEEFVWRSQSLRLQKRYDGKHIRVGDYVYLVDFSLQEVFMEDTGINYPTSDGPYHPLGGGRENNETQMENIVREIQEETEQQLTIDTTLLTFIATFQIESEPSTYDGDTWDGKEFNVFVYKISKKNINPCVVDHQFKGVWVPLIDVLSSNRFITYPIWKEFCHDRDLSYPEPDSKIIRQYMAWRLDQNRITTLSEFGTESECILNWQPPEPDSVGWKKITRQKSYDNLKELKEVIDKTFDRFSITIPHKIKKIPEYLDAATQWWDREIKLWLERNNYDQGSYLWPLRVALSGKTQSPSPFEILGILTKDEALQRLTTVLENNKSCQSL